MVAYRALILLFALSLIGCAPASPSPTIVPASEIPSLPATFTPAPDDLALIRNAQYQLGATDGLRIVQLTDGKYEEGAPGDVTHITVRLLDFIAKGSMDGTGTEAYAVLVAENNGGSGTFVFLTIYVNENGTLKFFTSRMVDDRPQINVLSFSGVNEIFLDAVVHGAQDPLCCPNLHMTRHYRLNKTGELTVADYVTFTPDGKPRTISIDSPANETEVQQSIQLKGAVAIAPFENNLVYHVYDAGGVELASGFINVTAPEAGGHGTFDTIIALGNILSGATVRIEVQDVSAADGSLLAMDSVELVVK